MGGGAAEVWVSHPFPQLTSTVPGSCPYAFLQPLLHQRGCTRGGHPRLNCQGCSGASSTSISGLLQPSVCHVEDLMVVASGHRPLPPQSLCGCVPLSDGDHPVCSPVSSSGRLDGLHRFEGSVPPGSGSSRISSFSTLCVQGSRFPIQSSVLWPLHGSTGLLSVMAPVSAILHAMGIRMRRYLDDWLFQSSSRESLLRDLQTVLGRCHELGVVINREKSHLVPSQVVQYLGVVINTQSFVASPSPDRISRLLSTAGEFRSSASPPARLWLSLLEMLSSLAHLVPGGRLRMRSLQLCLNRSWDHVDLSVPVAWTVSCLQDLQWWLHLSRLSQGVSLCQVSPSLDFWSEASDVGWGAHLGPHVASGLWDFQQASLSINARELLAIQHGLLHFQLSLRGHTVAVYCDNVTAVAYLRKEGDTRSPLLNTIAQEILRWSESLAIRLAP